MKYLKENKKKIVIAIITVIFIVLGLIIYKFNTGLELIQLSPQSHRQMMGYVLKTYKNSFIIIDGGTRDDKDNLLKYISSNSNTVDYWFITHLHDDHMGAFLEIAKNEDIHIKNIVFDVNELNWYTDNEPNRAEDAKEFFEIISKTKSNIINPKLNENIYIDNIRIKILGINNSEILTNAGNNSSMVMKYYIHDKTILFLGDTGVESEQKLIGNNINNLKSDIVQMAHHGQSGVDERMYKIINPKICLWPTTKWLWENDSGTGEDSGSFKTKETRKWIDNLNVKTNILAFDGESKIYIW